MSAWSVLDDSFLEEAITIGQLESGIAPALVAARGSKALVERHQTAYQQTGRNTPWTPAEMSYLRQNAHLSNDELGQRLGRSKDAVKIRRMRFGVPAPTKVAPHRELSARAVGDMMGWCGKKVKRLIHEYGLPARETVAGIHMVDVPIFYRWILRPENFVFVLNLQSIQNESLRRMISVRMAQWDDAWWSVGQVARWHGVDGRTVTMNIYRGRLPAVRWNNWRVLRSDAMAFRVFSGKGGYTPLDWSVDGDAFLVLARAVGIPMWHVDKLRNEERRRCAYRYQFLHKRDEITPLLQQRPELSAVVYDAADGRIFANWQEHADRFPGLVRGIARFHAGRETAVDRWMIRSVLCGWVEWYAPERADLLAKRTAVSGRDNLVQFWQEVVAAVGRDPLEKNDE
jgi:hypothetical protein